MFTNLPGKGNYQRHLSGMLPGGLLHIFSNYQELPENTPKNFILALKRVTGNGKMQLSSMPRLVYNDGRNSRLGCINRLVLNEKCLS
jgi:hypothetical protein